jgi:hypothetical protein
MAWKGEGNRRRPLEQAGTAARGVGPLSKQLGRAEEYPAVVNVTREEVLLPRWRLW